MLFGPAQRVDFVQKFVTSGADIGVLDLEDATPEAKKDEARATLIETRPGRAERGSMRLLIRTNSLGSSHFAADLAAAAESAADGVVVPKLETDREVADVRREMVAVGLGEGLLCAGIESVAGVHRAVEVAGAGADLVYFGAEDFITDIGGVRTESNLEVLYARSRVAIAARLSGIPALDQVVVDFGDDDRFRTEANDARALGFQGKLCIHPSQVSLATEVFTPSGEEITHARALLAAAADAEDRGLGVISFEGTMVDAPIILRARQILDLIED